MTYKIKTGHVGHKPYFMAYKHYVPNNETAGDAVMVLVGGGGHRMKVWEITPDGRPGWAPSLAEKGREVITVEWACNSPEIYCCSAKELCRLTQKENMDLIKRVIEKEVPRARKIIFLGWSMGGPQVFKLACDIVPRRSAAILGYATTGPLNFFKPTAESNQRPVDLEKPFTFSQNTIDILCNSQLFPKKHIKDYIKNYLTPISPAMVAIQAKHPAFKNYWRWLTVKNTRNIPPVFLVNGTYDPGHRPAKESVFINWLKRFQNDATLKYIKGFTHLGMISYGNRKAVRLYLDWLKGRGL